MLALQIAKKKTNVLTFYIQIVGIGGKRDGQCLFSKSAGLEHVAIAL